MNKILAFWRSSIGKKVVMAVTGIIWIGYVVVIHVPGNMLVFKGQETMDGYAQMLHSSAAALIWIARVVLFGSVMLHVIAAYQLSRMSQTARPEQYAERKPQASTFASRFMRWGGVVLLVFLIFHILHFTTGHIQPGTFVENRPYINVVTSFRVWWVSLFYLVAMAFLGLHLYHGAWASVRTLGATGSSKQPLRRTIAVAIAVFAWLGFSSIPVAVMLGWIK